MIERTLAVASVLALGLSAGSAHGGPVQTSPPAPSTFGTAVRGTGRPSPAHEGIAATTGSPSPWSLLRGKRGVQDAGARLREAARTGDIEQVRALLDEGVDVDAADRNGSTALFFAADRGHREVVELLLARGADPNRQDSFYNFTPVGKALMGDQREIAILLLESGATADAAGVLPYAVQQQDSELARAALSTGAIDAATLESALAAARSLGNTELVEMLEPAAAAATAAAPETVVVDPVTLRSYAGSYLNEDMGVAVTFTVEGSALKLSFAGQDPVPLAPTAQRAFSGPGGLAVTFAGRGDMVERVIVERGQQVLVLVPASAEEIAAATTGGSAEAGRVEEGGARGSGAGNAAAGVDPEDPAAAAGDPGGPGGRAGAEAAADRGAPINWPGFRGSGAAGVGDGQGIPVSWNVDDGTNVLWKTPVPGIANSSPIVWEDRVFVTTAVSSADDTVRTGLYGDVTPVEDLSSHSFRLFCLHRASGEILWERIVHEGPPQVKRHPKSSQANSTPVTDGEHVVVLFGTIGLLASYDLDGELQWSKDIGVLDSGWFYDPSYQWGHASSPVIYDGTVIVQADVQVNPFIAAFSLEDGEEVWRTPRDSIPSFSTPAIHRGEPRDELITSGTTIRSYDPATGELLWTLAPNSELVVASPVSAGGLIFLTGGYPPVRPIYAVRPGGSGDISPPEPGSSTEWVSWSASRGGTYIPSPLVYGELLYMNHNDGRLEAYGAHTGERVYRERIGDIAGSYVASPVAADGRLYFSSEDGAVNVVRAGPEYELLAANDMGEVIWATPAISPGVLVIRTLGHVWGIGFD